MHRPRGSFFALIALSLFAFLPLGRAAVLINEVAFDEPSGSPDWVELLNTGPGEVSLDGWTLDDEDAATGNEIVLAISTPVPAGAFLVVYVDAEGAEDLDFSDGRGVWYSGAATTVSLASTEDELVLRDLSGVVDFLAWVTDGTYGGTGDQGDAAAAGLWTSGSVVELQDSGSGYSLGRRTDGVDTNRPEDFSMFSSPTPGASNAAAPVLPSTATPNEVVINEISWGGTLASPNHEWMELFNNGFREISLEGWRLISGDGDVEIPLSGSLPPGTFFVLERTSDAPIGDRPADQIYVGSLSNGGEDLFLLDASSNVVDSARFEAGGWPGGSGAPDFRSMERITPSAGGDLWTNWKSNDGATRNGADAAGGPLNGTPGARNSGFRSVFPTGDDGVSSEDRVRVDPLTNPFSPRDPDPARRAAKIHFNGGSPSAAKTIRVCNVRGEVVRSFTGSDFPFGTGSGAVEWGGQDDNGRLLPPGIYVVHLESVEPEGARRRGKCTVVLGYPK